MTRDTKKNRKTHKKKQKTWTGGVRINEKFIQQYGEKTRAECMNYFMENATFKLLTNTSRSCITLIATYHGLLSPFKSMRSNHLDLTVRTILVKILLTDPSNTHHMNRQWHYTKPKRGVHPGIIITPIQEFRKEIKTQIDIYRKSFVSQTSLLDPICPAVIFFQDKIPGLEFSKYLAHFNTHEKPTYDALREIYAGTLTKNQQLSAIYMEYMDDYQLVNEIFNLGTEIQGHPIKPKPILIQNPTQTSKAQYELFIKIIQYELFKLNQLGYHHNDAHLANIMINKQYPYLANNDISVIFPGKVILIDFGEVQKIPPNTNPYQTFLQERFMEWVPTGLVITEQEIKDYDNYRVNYILGVSGKKILNKFIIRNKSLLEVVNLMSNREQFVTIMGGSVTVSKPKSPVHLLSTQKTKYTPSKKNPHVSHKKPELVLSEIKEEEEEEEEENIKKLLAEIKADYYDEELDALLSVEPKQQKSKSKSKSKTKTKTQKNHKKVGILLHSNTI
jgi:hypothetical protein